MYSNAVSDKLALILTLFSLNAQKMSKEFCFPVFFIFSLKQNMFRDSWERTSFSKTEKFPFLQTCRIFRKNVKYRDGIYIFSLKKKSFVWL